MNLIEANHQINMTSDHSVSRNDLFKSHLNAMSFNIFQHCSSCANHGDSASVSVAEGWCKCIMVMGIQLQEKTEKNSPHQKYH